ncbi:cytochrome P450 [Trametes coccinea BRFM310]|uniref:Cytochrome P450 n=1 Tax=Trametes coccinea (strain BRFM310) TaxID=1353009 RepID=A0A1Y2IQ08_TRAC3|nr:cytochrome P450 [Trametes coccinea BRFM310]
MSVNALNIKFIPMLPTSVGTLQQPSLVIGLLIVGLCWLSRVYRPVDTSRPPLLRHWIPWLGPAFEVGKDPDGFFTSTSKRLGPIFRVELLGQERIFVTSPSMISTVYRDSQSYDFNEIRLDIGEQVFSISATFGRQPYMVDHFMPAMHRMILPSNLKPIITAYIDNAYDCIRSSAAELHGSSVPLMSLIIPPAYHAAAHAAFGPGFPVGDSFPFFRTFDHSFHLLAANLPRWLLSEPLDAWEKLVDVVESYIDHMAEDDAEEAGALVRLTLQGREAAEWTNREVASLLSSLLWALQANAVFAAYWLFALQLQQSEGLAPLIAEVDNARRLWQDTHPSTSLGREFFKFLGSSSSNALPLVTSAIRETLRYTSQSYSIRRVMKPVQLGGYDLRVGEEVVCATRQAHIDDEIHPNAAAFDIRRYLEAPKPIKDGRLVANHSMAFGGGVSMCAGRHFAMAELKMFVAVMLTYATVEADPSSSSRPEIQWERKQGIMQPKGDLKVIVRKRQL